MANETDTTAGGIASTSSDGGSVDLSAVKRKRGRPPGSGNKTKSSIDTPKSESRSADTSTIDSRFLGDTAVCLLEIVDEVSAKVLRSKIQKAAPDKLEAFIELQSEVGLNEKDKKLVGMSVEAIARKYTLLSKFGPEVLLFAAVSQYGLRQERLHQFVAQIAADRAKEKKSEPAKEP
jgi:hypothetical protein